MATNTALTKALAGKKVDSVRQRDTTLDIDFEDGSTLTLHLSTGTGSVTLTGEDDEVQYKA